MAKDYVIDGGTGELDVGGNTLANRFDLPEAMIPQNLGQRYNIGGLVRMDFARGTNLEMFLKRVSLDDEAIKQLKLLSEETIQGADDVLKLGNELKFDFNKNRADKFVTNFTKIVGRKPSREEIVGLGKFSNVSLKNYINPDRMLTHGEAVSVSHSDELRELKRKKAYTRATKDLKVPKQISKGITTGGKYSAVYDDVIFPDIKMPSGKSMEEEYIEDFFKRFDEEGIQRVRQKTVSGVVGNMPEDALTNEQLAKKYWGVENPTKSDIRKASKVNQGIRARLIREGKFTPKYLTPQSAAEEGHKRSQLKEREARKYLGKQDKAIAKTQKQYVKSLNEFFQKNPEALRHNPKLVNYLNLGFDAQLGEFFDKSKPHKMAGQTHLSINNPKNLKINPGVTIDDYINKIKNENYRLFERDHIEPKSGSKISREFPVNKQILPQNVNQGPRKSVHAWLSKNYNFDLPPEKQVSKVRMVLGKLDEVGMRINLGGKAGIVGPKEIPSFDSKTNRLPNFDDFVERYDINYKNVRPDIWKRGWNIMKPAVKGVSRAIAPVVPFVGPGVVAWGLSDVSKAYGKGLTKPEELATAYYLGPDAAGSVEGIKENIKSNVEDMTWEGNIYEGDTRGYQGGGSVEPRVAYRDGTRMSPQPPKEKSFEEIIKELQIQYGIPDEEGFAVKDKLGRLGDIVDVRNYPYYGSKVGKGIMEAAEFSVRFPGAAGQLIHDVATGPGWKEQGLDFIKNVSPGWGWSEKVGLDSLIDEQVGAMKERGSSDAPASLGGVLNLGADIAMPLGYVYGAAKFGKFIKALGQTPDKISDFNKRIIDHLDSTGQSKRDFMTLVGTVGAMGAIKAMGLDKIFNVGKVIKGADDMIPMVKGSYSTMPKWFPMFIQRINPKMIYEGDGMSTFKGTDDFLPGIRVEKNGDDYVVSGMNDYQQPWTVSYEGPRWLEIEPGQKPIYFKGEFEVVDDVPVGRGPEDVDFEPEVIKEIDELLGGNARSMEEFATGKEIEGLTKGEKQVDWAEGRAQQAMDEAAELEAGVFDEVN